MERKEQTFDLAHGWMSELGSAPVPLANVSQKQKDKIAANLRFCPPCQSSIHVTMYRGGGRRSDLVYTTDSIYLFFRIWSIPITRIRLALVLAHAM
jgi:hypothetical protein